VRINSKGSVECSLPNAAATHSPKFASIRGHAVPAPSPIGPSLHHSRSLHPLPPSLHFPMSVSPRQTILLRYSVAAATLRPSQRGRPCLYRLIALVRPVPISAPGFPVGVPASELHRHQPSAIDHLRSTLPPTLNVRQTRPCGIRSRKAKTRPPWLQGRNLRRFWPNAERRQPTALSVPVLQNSNTPSSGTPSPPLQFPSAITHHSSTLARLRRDLSASGAIIHCPQKPTMLDLARPCPAY